MSLAAGSDSHVHLSVRDLSIAFGDEPEYAVDGLSFNLNKGECLGLVGESGSGKSLTALAAMQLLPNAARVGRSSQLYFNGVDVLGLSERKMRSIRGGQIAMVFQDALTALNPVYTIGQQLGEMIVARQKKPVAFRLLDEVGIKDVEHCYNSYPHQLSGGMRQRALIAMALAGEPQLLIADEPTTALDVTVQAQVVELLKRIRAQRQMSLLFISHDLALVAQLADNVVVMKSGRLQEQGPVDAVFHQPQREYTRRLLSAIPDGSIGQDDVEQTEPVLNVNALQVHFPIKKGLMKRTVGQVKAVDDVSFDLSAGQTLAIVGESGSGKTTCALALLRLLEATSGAVQFNGKSLFQSNLKQLRLDMQIVFQDPYSSLNPRRQVGDSIAEGLFAQRRVRSRREAMKQVDALLQQVQMPVDIKHRYPHEFSGGQRQRLCIARALALRPKVLILDEPTSALDVSIQKQVLELLLQLQQQHNLAYLLITHDLGVVAQVAHRVVVMNQGKVVESGSVAQVLQNPQQLYTQQLVSAMPTMTR